VNYRIIRRKDVEGTRTRKLIYILCGPFTTGAILKLNEKEMSEEEYIYDFYRNKLRSGLWTNDYKKLDLLVEVLKKENLSREQRIKLRRYINVDKMTRNDLFAIMTISTNVLIAAFIGFGAARAALGK